MGVNIEAMGESKLRDSPDHIVQCSCKACELAGDPTLSINSSSGKFPVLTLPCRMVN